MGHYAGEAPQWAQQEPRRTYGEKPRPTTPKPDVRPYPTSAGQPTTKLHACAPSPAGSAFCIYCGAKL